MLTFLLSKLPAYGVLVLTALFLGSPLFGQEQESPYNKGIEAADKGEHDLAIKFYDEAIKLDPKHEMSYVNRGVCYKRKGEYDRAIEDYNQAIQLNPNSVMGYHNRARAYSLKGDYAKTIADFGQILKFDPSYIHAYTALAWLLSTNPDAAIRDGKKAVQYATKACELTEWESSNAIGTLAAAYAEAGDFENALKWQNKMLEFNWRDKKDEETVRKNLALYQDHKPVRDLEP